ncbi:helix-turn-helix transcriptional regulator [Lentibacillus amyloliquefaciens]
MRQQKELAAIRRYFNYSQTRMANLLNIDVRTYINKENGVTQFKMNEMFIISKMFKKPIEEIFLYDDFMLREVE